jgi:hypothetical protein
VGGVLRSFAIVEDNASMRNSPDMNLGAASNSPAPKSRFRRLFPLLLSLAVLFAAMLFVFPIIFGPRIDVPTDVRFASPSSLAIQISNPNLTPLTDVEYRCEVSKLILADGSEVANAGVLNQGVIRRLEGRRAIMAHCQTASLLTAPLRTAEYTLKITYRTYPWRQELTKVYRISAQFDKNSQIIAWKVN